MSSQLASATVPHSGVGSGVYLWSNHPWWWKSALCLGESIETEPPHDAWAVLRRDQLWKQIMDEQMAEQAATARVRNIAALNAEAAAAAALSSLSSSSLSAIPADALHRPMMRLADIELQLVMQMLPFPDLLRFARACRRTMGAASSSFALQGHVLPVKARTRSDFVAQLRGLSIAGLVRHAPLSLRWKVCSCLDTCVRYDVTWLAEILDHIATGAVVQPLHRIELQYPALNLDKGLATFKDWFERMQTQVFPHPSLRSLRVVQLGQGGWREGNAAVLEALAAMPHLHSLSVAPDTTSSYVSFRGLRVYTHSDFDSTPEAAQAWSRLAAIPGLTALNIADSGTSASGSRLPHVYACSKLEELGVVWPSLYGLSWTTFFSAPAIQNLQSLSLDFFDASSTRPGLTEALRIPEGAFAAGWASMLRLRTLTLRHIRGIDQLLPSIAAAPVLESLVLFPGVRCVNLIPDKHDTVPTPSILTDLIHSTAVSVTLQIVDSPRNCRSKTLLAGAYQASILAQTMGRFTITFAVDSQAVPWSNKTPFTVE